MLHLKYYGEDEIHAVSYKSVSEHIVHIEGDMPVKRNGFTLSRIGRDDNWDYKNFTTVYREFEGGVEFSNDGSVYVAPIIPEPEEPEPYVPTLEEIKEFKKQEIRSAYQMTKALGVDVELSTGIEHFPLTDEDITFLMGKQFELSASSSSSEAVSYQDSENRCKFYSRDDMQAIIQTALQFVNFQTTYRNNLCEWVDECQEKDEIEEITYGCEIPEQYQNDVLKSYLNKMGGITSEDV